jgi:DNA-binding response OmpR family regulator
VLAVSSVATRDAALEAGAAAFLQKPLEPLQLVSTVKDLLGMSSYLKEVVPER